MAFGKLGNWETGRLVNWETGILVTNLPIYQSTNVLERMKDVPPERRTARFVVAWALIAPDESEHVRNVSFPFRIATEQVRPISPGAPTSAVMLGPEKIMEARSEEIAREFERWSILAELFQ